MHAPREHSIHDYDEIEGHSDHKFEFVEGRIVAMAGGTVEHGWLATTVSVLLANQLRGSQCRVANSDVRVGHEASDFRAYPDCSVICGTPTFATQPPNTVTNPVLIIEVTSDSTESRDRGSKLAAYQRLESVAGVLIVSHRWRQIAVHRRTADGWSVEEHGSGAFFEVPGMNAQLAVDSIYDEALGPDALR